MNGTDANGLCGILSCIESAAKSVAKATTTAGKAVAKVTVKAAKAVAHHPLEAVIDIGTVVLTIPLDEFGAGEAIDAEVISAEAATSVFWSGGEAAESAATKWALENGGQTLGMTEAGQQVAAQTAEMEWEDAQPLWQAASKQFAEDASGNVHVFLNPAGMTSDSLWLTTESPTLVNNPSVSGIIEHVVGEG